MNCFKTTLLASLLLGGSAVTAVGQSSNSSGSADTGNVSAATHCRDSSGNVQLRTAMSGGGLGSTSGMGSGSSTTGSAGGGSGSAGMTSGSGSGGGSASSGGSSGGS